MQSPHSPTKYLGPTQYNAVIVSRPRTPTGADLKQPETGKLYPIGCIWQVSKDPTDGVEGEMWELTKIVANVSYWSRIQFVGDVAAVLSLSGDADTDVFPDADGNIKILGTSGQILVTEDAANNKMVISLVRDSGFTWTDVSGAFSALKNIGYFVTGTATGTLPASPAQGDTIKFCVKHASQVLTIAATGSQIIRLGSNATVAAGTAVSTLQGDSLELTYSTSDTTWYATVGAWGTWILT